MTYMPTVVPLPAHLTDFPLAGADVVEYGSFMGVHWVITKSRIYGFNGYIQVPAGHVWEGADYDELNLELTDVPEVTFGQGRWFGFDTAHDADHWDKAYDWRGDWSHIGTPTRFWDFEKMRLAVLNFAVVAHTAGVLG